MVHAFAQILLLKLLLSIYLSIEAKPMSVVAEYWIY